MAAPLIWGEKVRQAYQLLIEAAELDRAKVRSLTVTFEGKSLASYEVKGFIKEQTSPPNLDMGTQTVGSEANVE